MSYNVGDKVIYKGDIYAIKSVHVDYHTAAAEYTLEPRSNKNNGTVIGATDAHLTPYWGATPNWATEEDKTVVLPVGNKSNGCTCGAYITSFPDFHYDWCPKWKK